MSGEISINIQLFRTNIQELKKSINDLQTNNMKQHNFSYTNIDPFMKDLENIIRTIKLIEKYQVILEKDLVTLLKTGEEMKEIDEKLSKMLRIPYNQEI